MECEACVTAIDMCDDIKNFSMKVTEACVTAEKAISTKAYNCFGFGFCYAENAKIIKLLEDKTSGWLNLREYLLRSAMEKVAGNKFECEFSYSMDPKYCKGYWNITMRTKQL